MRKIIPPIRQHGVSLLEVLISLVIMSVGLLGLAGLMTVSMRSEMESYQRVQALSLLADMSERMAANRGVATCYISSNYGKGGDGNNLDPDDTCASGTTDQFARANADILAWHNSLIGSSEVKAAGSSKVGGLAQARGCIERVSSTAASGSVAKVDEYRISVAWLGLENVSEPDSDLTCGAGGYGIEGNRRVVATLLRIPAL